MTTWAQFEHAAGEFAAVVRARFEAAETHLLATLRKDGFPSRQRNPNLPRNLSFASGGLATEFGPSAASNPRTSSRHSVILVTMHI